MNKQIQRPLRVVFFHIMRENFSGAQKNIFRLLINLNKGKIQPFLIGQVEAPLTKLTEKERIETKIISFPSGMEVFDQKRMFSLTQLY